MSGTQKNTNLQLHAAAVNLARRYSVQNENDLMQEDMFDNTMDSPQKNYDHDYCEELSKHLTHLSSLPAPCLAYKDVATGLKRRETDTTDPTSMLG